MERLIKDAQRSNQLCLHLSHDFALVEDDDYCGLEVSFLGYCDKKGTSWLIKEVHPD